VKNFLFLICILFVGCCGALSDKDYEPQLVQIFLHHGQLDEVNTFEETLTKDLIPGTVKTSFWFTKREQEIILSTAERYGFFNFPDTILAKPDITIRPDHGAEILHIKEGSRDKTVVWFYPPDQEKFKYFSLLIELRNLILNIVESKPEYKVLPPRKGGYQ